MELLRCCGAGYPQIRQVVSLVNNEHIEQPVGPVPDFSVCDVVFSFEGLIRKTPFVAYIRELLTVSETQLGLPVDIEFAYDGDDFTSCSAGRRVTVAMLSRLQSTELPSDQSSFSANRFVSNGRVPRSPTSSMSTSKATASFPNNPTCVTWVALWGA